MNPAELVRRSLRHYRRTNLGVVLGAACATTVLVGALAVGDSVRQSLREQALQRIGRVDLALAGGDRFFGADLAERLAGDLQGTELAPVLQLRGVVSHTGSASRAGIVDVLGVDRRFFALSPGGKGPQLPTGNGAFVNERLARQLGANPGDTLLLRVEKPSTLPRDMLMATIDDVSFAMRLEVRGVVSEAEFGRFSLRASQIPPFGLFVSLPWLQQQLQLEGRANMLVAGGTADAASADAALRQHWNLADAELQVERLDDPPVCEVTSGRVFLDDAVVKAIAGLEPRCLGVLTYFVNDLRAGERVTPYSTVTALGPLTPDTPPTDPALVAALTLLPPAMPKGGVVLNQWCADDLQAAVGDSIELRYFAMGPELRLQQRTHRLTVSAVVPLAGAADDPGLMPEFPGLANAESCRDWEPGIPIELDRLRDQDQKYWDEHRGTPKAFVSLPTGQELWSSRFGQLTAVRAPAALAERFERELPRRIDPASLGLFFVDVRGSALAAGTSATDFGGLFLGLSFFLIVAAMLLTALLFVFGVEQRAREIGTLLAVGFRPAQVRRLFLIEALVLASIGGAIGAVAGLGYTRGVLWGLGTLWQDAVGATTLSLAVSPLTVAGGALLAIGAALLAIRLTLRRTFDRPAVELLASRGGIAAGTPPPRTRARRLDVIVPGAALVLALVIVLAAGTNSAEAAGAFFGAGGLLLVGAIFACRGLLRRLGDDSRAGFTSVAALALRNAGRRPGRSLATIALLASGTFLVVAVQANRLEPPRDFAERSSGTGGFALFGRSTLPVLRDLDTEEGREAYGLEAEGLQGVSIVPLRVREGDDASCLNLSLPQNPRLLGVRAAALADRGAFSFQGVLPPDGGAAPASPWLLLDADYGDGVVPAIGDSASITWALHKALGDTLDYRDERGREFRVKLVGAVGNSILQGNLIVSDRQFQARYPSASGFSTFLVDAPPDRVDAVATDLTDAFEDLGLELTSTTERLDAFNAVQNTYLSIFQALGGLGLLLGSVGLGMVVLRNALERRGELALLSAVGFGRGAIRRLVWIEHGVLLALGLLSAVVAAIVAVLPGLGGDGLSVAPMLALVAALALSGALWVWLATALATRGSLLGALQDE